LDSIVPNAKTFETKIARPDIQRKTREDLSWPDGLFEHGPNFGPLGRGGHTKDHRRAVEGGHVKGFHGPPVAKYP